MTYEEFKALCEREWANGHGNVVELHLDPTAFKKFCNEVDQACPYGLSGRQLSGVMNETTATWVGITVTENHVVVTRSPQPAGTSHIVKI